MYVCVLGRASCSKVVFSTAFNAFGRRYIHNFARAALAPFGSHTIMTARTGKPVRFEPANRFSSLGKPQEESSGKPFERTSVRDKILTVPNGLCALRIGLTPVIGYLVVNEHFFSACSLFVIASLTDLMDGYIARHVRGQASLLGSIIDPLADKFLVTTLFLTLTYVNLIPAALTVLVIFRDIALIIGGIIKRCNLLVPPVTIKRFFNPSVSPVRVAPTLVSKANTALQLAVITLSLASPVFGFVGHPYLSALYAVTAVTTVYSGLQYAFLDRMKRA